MRVVVNYRKGQKQLKKIVLHLKSTLARPPIYDRAYPQKLSTTSPGNPVGITKPSSILLIVQPIEKSLEESRSLEETNVLTTFGIKSMRKVRSESKVASKSTDVDIAQSTSQFK